MFRQDAEFGFPLAFGEISMVLLAFADILMLKHFLGDISEVGVYKIGYSLAMYISMFLQTSLFAAFVPVANRVYENEGVESFQHLKQGVTRVLIYICMAVILGLYVAGGDFLVLI